MDEEKIQNAVRMFLEGIGEDPNREGLRDTPLRVARMCREILSSTGQDVDSRLRVLHGEKHDEIVLVKNIPFCSICEHHLLPFVGYAHVAYLPQGERVLGISKLARLVELHSRRLQLQERLTTQIAESMVKLSDPKGVLVILTAEHLCMTMRGVKKPGSKTVTSVVRGMFRENHATRAEAMALIGNV